MSKKKIEVPIYATITIDQENSVVQDYQSIDELLGDITSYCFSPVLPVIDTKGVVIEEMFHGDYDTLEDEEE